MARDTTTRFETARATEEPMQPSATIGQCVNGGMGWLEVECNRCKARASLPVYTENSNPDVMARPARPEQTKSAGSSRQLGRFFA
jgi:hypothetical protein